MITDMVAEPVNPPSSDVAVIIEFPTAKPETWPELLTDAIVEALDVNLTPLFVALEGSTFALIYPVEPNPTLSIDGVT